MLIKPGGIPSCKFFGWQYDLLQQQVTPDFRSHSPASLHKPWELQDVHLNSLVIIVDFCQFRDYG